MQFSLKQLEAFVWVADLGSFRKAADRLNTTQPNISARIAALEAVLNTTLMERDAGSVRLTTKGADLLRHARQVLRDAEALVEASGQAALVEGTLRLGVTEMVVHSWLREFLKALSQQFPNLTVELTVDLSVVLEKELLDRGLDLALQNEPFRQQTSGSRDLGSYPLVWVASPGLNLHRRGPVAVEDLVRHPILTHGRDTRLFVETAAHFAARRDLAARLVPSSNLAACLYMALNGMGVAALPEAMVAPDLARGDLVRLDYGWRPQSLHFFARYDAERAPDLIGKAAAVAAQVAADYGRRGIPEE